MSPAIVGLDTSTAATSACVLLGDGTSFEVVPDVAALLRPPAHARELMPAIVECLDRARVGFDELDAVAVGVGPGTFTGLRVGIATARAIAAAAAVGVRPVSSLRALAAGAGGEAVLAAIDAKRGELFAALYAGAEELIPPFAATPDEVARRAAAAAPGALAVGDGSLRFRQALEAAGLALAADDSPAHVVRALHVCQIARSTPPAPPEAVVPAYLRDPDATPQ